MEIRCTAHTVATAHRPLTEDSRPPPQPPPTPPLSLSPCCYLANFQLPGNHCLTESEYKLAVWITVHIFHTS